MSILKTLAGFSARAVETGLMTMGSALGAVQSAVGAATGLRSNPAPTRPEYDGPHDLDRATSELANRLARLMRYWIVSGNGGFRDAAAETWAAARKSFEGIDLKSPR